MKKLSSFEFSIISSIAFCMGYINATGLSWKAFLMTAIYGVVVYGVDKILVLISKHDK